jgi:hypothetical protein
VTDANTKFQPLELLVRPVTSPSEKLVWIMRKATIVMTIATDVPGHPCNSAALMQTAEKAVAAERLNGYMYILAISTRTCTMETESRDFYFRRDHTPSSLGLQRAETDEQKFKDELRRTLQQNIGRIPAEYVCFSKHTVLALNKFSGSYRVKNFIKNSGIG